MPPKSPSPKKTRPPSPGRARPASPGRSKPASDGKAKKPGGGGPANWPTCPWCGQKFRDLEAHEAKCRDRPEALEEAAAVAELARIEGPRPPEHLPDWEQCPNCGEQYGEFALGPHMKRCIRLLPYGKKKDGKQYGSGPPPAGTKKPKVDDYGSGLSQEEIERLRELFQKHDADGNELLDEPELGGLLKECFPERVKDADRLMAEFKVADLNNDGTVSFPEFVRYYAVLQVPPPFRPAAQPPCRPADMSPCRPAAQPPCRPAAVPPCCRAARPPPCAPPCRRKCCPARASAARSSRGCG